MSRSDRAWTERSAPARPAAQAASMFGAAEARAGLGDGLLPAVAHPFARLARLVEVAVLVVALAPATSAARTDHHSTKPQRKTTQAAHRARAHDSARATARKPERSPGARRVATTRPRLLVFGMGYGISRGSTEVRSLQRRLAREGYSPGPIDGKYGPLTQAAVSRFQAASDLLVDGIAGPHTLAALDRSEKSLLPFSGYRPGGSASVRSLQRRLAGAGFAPGPIDGRYGPLTEAAVGRFQGANGLPVSGIADPRTVGRLSAKRHPPRQLHRRPHPDQLRSKHPVPGSRPVRSHPTPPSGTRAPAVPRAHASHAPGSSWLVWLALLSAAVLAAIAILIRNTRRSTVSRPLAPVPGANRGANPVPTVERGTIDAPRNQEAESRRADRLGDPVSAFHLGVLLEEQGDLAGAESAYRRADRQGHAEAACNLGSLLEKQGRLTEAEKAFTRADRRGGAAGAFNLAMLREERGDLAGAESAYRRADRRGHAEAACNLGVLLEQQGKVGQAEQAFIRADRRGDPHGTFNLGVLLEQTGNRGDARAAFERAAERGSAEVRQEARAALLKLQHDSTHVGPRSTGGGGNEG